MSTKKLLAMISILSILAACTATGPMYSESQKVELDGKSEVIVFRKKKLGASGSKYCVKVDGNVIGILSSGGYLRTIVEPGKHNIEIPFRGGGGGIMKLDITSEAGKKNFVLYSVDLASMFAFPIGTIAVVNSSWNMSLVDTPTEYGKSQIQHLREAKVADECEW